jgi:hypothetical protein|nr:MAG TPA: hypothetical protein [Caudoviricetes sp.]
MGINELLALIGALGGLEAIKWVVNFYVNRKTNARKEDAAADAAENENERKQIAWLEERIAQRDAKIDALYIELRHEQQAKLEEIHKRHGIELQLKDAEYNRCEMPDNECHRRIPPRRRIGFIKEEDKE